MKRLPKIILAWCWLLGAALELGAAGEVWPDAPPVLLREDLFGVRFNLALHDGGPSAALQLLLKEHQRAPAPHTKAYLAWLSLFPKAWNLPPPLAPAPALALAQEAMMEGSAVAADVLGRARVYGAEGTEQNSDEGLRLLLEAAGRGNARALAVLGLYQVTGFRQPANVGEGVKKARRAAELGSTVGLGDIAEQFASGRVGGAPNPVVAMEYYLLMAGHGDSAGMHQLRTMWEKGVPRASFYYFLARLRFANESGGIAEARAGDAAEALEKMQGFEFDPRAWIELGIAHLEGTFARRDYPAARHYFTKAGGLHNPDAPFFLALMKLHGFGEARDPAAAFASMEALADAGNARAAARLGYLYYWGSSDVPKLAKDEKKAFHYLRMAAEAGEGSALLNLGFLYEHGIGVTENAALAAKSYGRAYQAGWHEVSERIHRNLKFARVP